MEVGFCLEQISQYVSLDVDGSLIYVLMSQEQCEPKKHTIGDNLPQDTVHLYLFQSSLPRLGEELHARLGYSGLPPMWSCTKG